MLSFLLPLYGHIQTIETTVTGKCFSLPLIVDEKGECVETIITTGN
jgi:hypothetical protein